MKRTLLMAIAAVISLASMAQAKKDSTQQKHDSTIVIVMKPAEFEQYAKALDQLIDSKNATKQLLDFLYQRARVMPVEADKPKEQKPVSPPKQ